MEMMKIPQGTQAPQRKQDHDLGQARIVRSKLMKFRYIALIVVSIMLLVACDNRTPTVSDQDAVKYQLIVTTDRDIIYADNGKTLAKITAFLTDEDGVPKSGSSIIFFPSQGKMVGSANTDQTGRATSNFDDDGQPTTLTNPVRIVAQYTDSGTNFVRDTVYVQVLPMEALVDTFFVDTQPAGGQIVVTSLEEAGSIKILSHVFDSNGSPVSDVQVEYRVIDRESGVGYIDVSFDSTNGSGVSQTTFYTNAGRIGDASVVATISNDAVETLMRNNPGVYTFNNIRLAKGAGTSGVVFADTARVQAIASPPYQLTVSTLDDIIYADQGATTSRIIGIVRDTTGNPVQGVSVSFSSNYGTINSPKITDDAGVVQTTFSDLGNIYLQDQVARITGKVTHMFYGEVTDTANVQIRLPDDATSRNFYVITQPPSGNILITDQDSVYSAKVMAQVRDNRGVALAGVTVDFRVTAGSNLGYLSAATDVSDSTGTARVAFYLNPNTNGTVTIESFVAGDASISPISKNLVFFPMTDYEINTFTYQSLIYYDNGLTTARVYAVVRDLEGNSVDSIKVNFSADIGTINSPVYTNNAGVAESVFSDLGAVGPGPAIATITARVLHPFWGIHTNTVQVNIHENEFELPKVPAFIDMSASFDELPPVGQPTVTVSELSLFVSDSNGFAVDEGTEVTFSTRIGYVTPFTLTDEDGYASAMFTMGDSSGIAKVYAYSGIASDSVLIRVRPAQAAYVIIPPVTPNFIVVQGGWGAESTTLRAEVRDARGELVDSVYAVTFTIGPRPSGANLNGVGDVVTVETNYGVASATLNAGIESGPVQLRVSVRLANTNIIQAMATPVVIRAGLPAQINADLNISSFEAVGGGFYEIEVAALVWDRYTNPVEDSTQIYWSIVPDSICNVIGESFTNNENISGESYPGMAWSKMYFNSGVIFDQIQISARTWGADGDTIRAFVNEDADSLQGLPFYPGTLLVTPSIAFHDFGTSPGSTVDVTLTALLIDFYGNSIKGGRILFSAIGVSGWKDANGNSIPIPIQVTDDNGMAVVIATFSRVLCTPNFDAGGVTVVSYDPFTAFVWGTLIDPQITSSDQSTIELRRSIPE